jgi:hypothetical protein
MRFASLCKLRGRLFQACVGKQLPEIKEVREQIDLLIKLLPFAMPKVDFIC